MRTPFFMNLSFMKRNKIFCLIAFLLSCLSCKQQKVNSLVFAQLCDPQLGMGGYEKDKKSLEKAITILDSLKIDFALICGDLVHNAVDSTYKDFKHILQKSKTPFYLASGNHDLGNIPTSKTLAYYRSKMGNDYYSFAKNNNYFMVINSQLLKVNVENESEKHYKWIQSTLDSLGRLNQNTFVVGHYPLYIENPNEKEAYFNLPTKTRKQLLDSFVKNKVTAYLSGHSHTYISNKYQKLLLISGETTSKNFDNRPLGFRLWEVSKDSISHKFISID